MKKKWLIAAVCALALMLAACAGEPQVKTTQAPTETTEATVPTEPPRPAEKTNILRWDGIPDDVAMIGE